MVAPETDIDWDPRLSANAGIRPALARVSEAALAAPTDELRMAWWGRVSTEDMQDPTLSLPRQLANSRRVLPAEAVIVAHFYDIESGRLDLSARGHGTAHELFSIPIPRAGGIQDLLAEAARPDRRFDAVICESIERVARRTYYGTQVEHLLQQAGVELLAADEPINRTGKRATQILTRRVKQSVAEWYVLDILEKSWDGLREHTLQGWNVGRPPYGYQAEAIPHPVPARRAEGKTKTRLLPDPVRGPVVTRIFTWRSAERLGYQTIAERLNADLTANPPPTALDPARQRDAWSRSAVREILRNPKYSGFMVYNRRASSSRNGKVNPPSAWIWSAEPTHEPLVTVALFDAASPVAAERERSRGGSRANAHPQTKRTYPLRSYVVCDLCGRRMSGKTKKGAAHVYYNCRPALNHTGRTDRFPGHPANVYVRDDLLVAAVQTFFATRVLGPDRHDRLRADIQDQTTSRPATRQADQRKALDRSLADLDRREGRLIRTLETQDDPDGLLTDRVRTRLTELHQERRHLDDRVRQLDSQPQPEPVADPSLLDELPLIEVKRLAELPQDIQRGLYDAFHLEVRYNRTEHAATIRIRLTDDGAGAAASLLQDATDAPAGPTTASVAHLVCAPNGIRTRATALKGRRPRPLDDEGGGPAGRLHACTCHSPAPHPGAAANSVWGLRSGPGVAPRRLAREPWATRRGPGGRSLLRSASLHSVTNSRGECTRIAVGRLRVTKPAR